LTSKGQRRVRGEKNCSRAEKKTQRGKEKEKGGFLRRGGSKINFELGTLVWKGKEKEAVGLQQKGRRRMFVKIVVSEKWGSCGRQITRKE